MCPGDIAGSVRVRGRGGTRLQPGIDLLDKDPNFPRRAPLLIVTDGEYDVPRITGREHAYLVPRNIIFPSSRKGLFSSSPDCYRNNGEA